MPEVESIRGQSEGKPVSKRRERSVGVAGAEPIDVDVTPVMNLFLVLIPFLVSMAVFTHLSVVEFSLPPAVSKTEGSGKENDNKELDISVVITQKGYTIVGSGQKLPLVPRINNEYDFNTLIRQLKAIKYKYPQQESVVLVIEPNVIYNDIIHFMDQCRESQFPNIGVAGGFQ